MINHLLLTKFKTYIWHSIKQLGNLTLAISLLLSIAFFSIIGTVIEQNQNLQFYIDTYSEKNKILQVIDWKIIQHLQLDHVYTNWWFIGLIVTFSISLIVCTLSRQLPILKNARKWKFYSSKNKISTLTYTTALISPSLTTLIFILNKKNYYTFQQKHKIYAYNGLAGRLAPVFVHCSIILLLTGSLLGLFGGLLIQEMITVGETIHPQNIISSGQISYLQQEPAIHVNNFSIKYNSDNSIQQFISNVSILDSDGHELLNKELQVNTPMFFQNMTIYQIDWDIIALRLRLQNNDRIQLPCQLLKKNNNKVWISNLKTSSQNMISIVIPDLTGKLYIYSEKGNLIDIKNIHEKIYIRNTSIYFEDILIRTGLQIKTDPGNWLVYISFGILIISVILSYTSYSQIWIVYYNTISYLGGKTNRAHLDFEEDIKKIQAYNLYAFRKISKPMTH